MDSLLLLERKLIKTIRHSKIELDAHPTEDLSSSLFDNVIVIIDTCLVVSRLQKIIRIET